MGQLDKKDNGGKESIPNSNTKYELDDLLRNMDLPKSDWKDVKNLSYNEIDRQLLRITKTTSPLRTELSWKLGLTDIQDFYTWVRLTTEGKEFEKRNWDSPSYNYTLQEFLDHKKGTPLTKLEKSRKTSEYEKTIKYIGLDFLLKPHGYIKMETFRSEFLKDEFPKFKENRVRYSTKEFPFKVNVNFDKVMRWGKETNDGERFFDNIDRYPDLQSFIDDEHTKRMEKKNNK